MVVIISGTILVLLVLILSLFTIKKGYAYKHTIDPLEPGKEIACEKDEMNK